MGHRLNQVTVSAQLEEVPWLPEVKLVACGTTGASCTTTNMGHMGHAFVPFLLEDLEMAAEGAPALPSAPLRDSVEQRT